MDLQNIRAPIRVAMKSTTTGKGKLYADGCANTGIAAIGNGMVEIYSTDRSVTLVGFDTFLSKKEITIGGAAGAIDLPTGPVIVQLNKVPFLHGATNLLLSSTQAREFGVKVHDVAKRHRGKQMIQAGDKLIPLKLECALIYTPIWVPTQWELNNTPRIVLTIQKPWDPTALSEDMPSNAVYPRDVDMSSEDE